MIAKDVTPPDVTCSGGIGRAASIQSGPLDSTIPEVFRNSLIDHDQNGRSVFTA